MERVASVHTRLNKWTCTKNRYTNLNDNAYYFLQELPGSDNLLTFILTYLFTPWSIVLLEQLTGSQVV